MKLPIELHTREGLMQLWSGVQYYPKQLQMKIRREIDRRNRLKHLGKPFTLILLLFISLSYSQTVIDTNEEYYFEIHSIQETEDCSVRALASAGYTYYEAHNILRQYGRQYRQGVSLRSFLRALYSTGRLLDVQLLEKPLQPKEFIKRFSGQGCMFFVFNRFHTFLIKDNKIYGNANDKYTFIAGYIEVSYSK